MESGLTSIIIVSYYTGPALEAVMTAALAQTEPIEVVVVSNGNPPEAENRLAARAQQDPRLQLVTGRENIGLGAGRNLGASKARGDFLLFLGDGCLLPPDAVARLRRAAAGAQQPCVFGARLVDEQNRYLTESRRPLLTPSIGLVWLSGLGPLFPKLQRDFGRMPLPEDTVAVPAVSGEVLFISAGDFARLKGFNEASFSPIADMDFFQRLLHAEGTAYFVSALVAKRTKTAPRPDGVEEQKRNVRSAIRYFHEHFGHSHSQPVLWLLDALLWLRFAAFCFKTRASGTTPQ